MRFVLDGSLAIAWCFEDETTPRIEAIIAEIARDAAVVPAIWRLEVANALENGHRRGRVTETQREDLLSAVMNLNVETDPETDRHVWPSTVRLAQRHRLSIYDASYLELARRLTLPLATLDRALLRAAPNENVEVVDMAG